jgi:TM2 domain-containing membrane protein YozV
MNGPALSSSKGRAAVAMLLALAVPGAGHFYLGRHRRALAFFAIVVVLFSVGIFVDGDLYTLMESRGSLLRVLASYASMGSGLLYLTGKVTGPHGAITSSTYEYGRMFTLTAGLMNLLLVLDCFDIAIGRKPW